MTATINPICISRKELASVAAALALSLLPASADSVVTVAPVKTTALRLEVQSQDKPHRYAMGIYEWRIK